MPAQTSADRLARLLNLVPYLLARPGIRVADAAADFGVSERTLRDDLDLLWVCGLPGYGPGDLIDMAMDGETVTITYDAGIDRPLRLTPDEALALVVALRLLAETPGTGERDAIERALAKLESAAGQVGDPPVAVRLPGNADQLDTIRTAVASGKALSIRYYAATRDQLTERVIDPIRILVVGGHAYLQAWCRRAEAVRLFRVDRIDGLAELDEPARPVPADEEVDLAGAAFTPTEELPVVTLRIGRASRWITEYYPCDEVVRDSDEHWLVRLRAGDLGWARRLVLGLGPDVQVVAPAALASDVRAQAMAALASYGVAPADAPVASPVAAASGSAAEVTPCSG